MKRRIFLLLACLAGSLQTFAQDEYIIAEGYCTNCFGFDSVLTYDVGGGYRQDNLEWKRPFIDDVVTRERWKDIAMGVVETNVQFLACDHYLFKVDFDIGWFNNRSGRQRVWSVFDDELINSLNARTRGRAYNIEGTVGYQFNLFCYRFSLAPLVGYSYHYQKFKNSHYNNELFPNFPIISHNRYIYRWRGPVLGLTTAYQICCEWQVYFTYLHHWARFRGKAKEHFVVGELPSHLKANNGNGDEFILGTTYEFCYNWLFGIKLNYKTFAVNKGKFITEIEQPGPNLHEVFPLRNVHWNSFTATIDVAYIF